MFWPDKNVFTIDIPKTACVTRWRIAKAMYGSRIIPGHQSMATVIPQLEEMGIDVNKIEFWTIIRNPEKRFLSSCNYHYAQMHRSSGDQGPALHDYFMQVQNSRYKNGTVYRPQSSWLDVDIPVKIWPMEYYDDMIRALGWDGEIKRENKSHRRWTHEDLINDPNYNTMMSAYSEDWDLYNTAISNFQ